MRVPDDLVAPLSSGLTPWPRELSERYVERGYWDGRTLGRLLRDWTAAHGRRLALVAGEQRLTYRQLDERADRMAAGLADLGIRAGDRVLVQLPNTGSFPPLLFALARIGAVAVLTLPAHRFTEISHLAKLSGAVAYVIADEVAGFDYRQLAGQVTAHAPELRHVLVDGEPGPYTALASVDAPPREFAEPDPADIALLLVSGGTTGVPKLIPRTHNDYGYNARASAEVCELDRDTVYLACLPIAHNFPLACPGMLGTFSVGGTVVLSPSPAPDDAFPLIEAEGVTHTALVPPLIPLWIETAAWDPADLSTLEILQAGGSKLSAELARRIPDALGCRVQQVFGMAEGLLNYTRGDDDEDTVVSTQGRPMCPDDELRVVDADGADVASGEVGELLVRGPYTLRGYYRAPEVNATAFTPDGYYTTGDLVRALPSGHLVVEGRVKDTIDRNGESVSGEEIESHLHAHPLIDRCAAVGVPDGAEGQLICVALRPPAGATPPELADVRAFLLERGVAAFKLPDLLAVVDDLPLTAIGKIDKRALAAAVAP
ncbi:(2,3-dihydroxybenzoyl)adenylate synthase [Micromonospora sp. KC723]|uniref:(2,3-dihydroxybenzoyl)adenylate synthase n=1 Tax=Micromonospora sp. KC723 TaxID=2530381 RepID=UPI00104CA4EE|nr:AMP-binding protein [Micromonospora sp. KC723]TDB76024.1 2,3-dihydroxybenzoate-AMP ligase [Micromonospora sp. KC723]